MVDSSSNEVVLVLNCTVVSTDIIDALLLVMAVKYGKFCVVSPEVEIDGPVYAESRALKRRYPRMDITVQIYP